MTERERVRNRRAFRGLPSSLETLFSHSRALVTTTQLASSTGQHRANNTPHAEVQLFVHLKVDVSSKQSPEGTCNFPKPSRNNTIRDSGAAKHSPQRRVTRGIAIWSHRVAPPVRCTCSCWKYMAVQTNVLHVIVNTQVPTPAPVQAAPPVATPLQV